MGYFTLKLILNLIDLFPKFDLTDKLPVAEGLEQVTNWFAWANYFLPTATIVSLLGLTALFYTFKLGVRTFKAVRDFL